MVVQNKQCWKAGALFAVGLCAMVCMATLCRFEKTDAGEVSSVFDTSNLPKPETDNGNEAENKVAVDLDKRVNLHGKVVGPDGKPDLPKGGRLVVRALTADNEGNYFGDHTTVDTDGKFTYSAVCNLNYEMVVYDNAGKWASKPIHLELGEKAPEKEIVIELVQGSLVEGTVLNFETGKPLPGTNLLFFRYFEISSKTDGTPRVFPVTHFMNVDENGQFRVAVLPGTYGVASESQWEKLFFKPKEGFPENFIQNGWSDGTEMPFTAFVVSEGETVKPILRISEETLSKEVNMEKRVDVRGKVVLPEGGELRGRTSITVRALSADNKSNYFGDHTLVNEDGTFVYHAVCNLNYMMTVKDEFGEWASEQIWLEVGNEPPKDEIVFHLVKGSVIEGMVLAQETGKPLSQVQLIFGQYFETKTKPEGEKRISLVTDVFHTDSEGKFRKTVLPGEYGVATRSNYMPLFSVYGGFPDHFFADNWDENKKTEHTAFRVKEGETVRPVLRLPEDSDDVKTPMPIRGKVIGLDGEIPKELTVHVRALSAENDTNMYMTGGDYSEDGKILLMEPKNQNYMIAVYDPNNVWAAKPVMVEVGKEAPKDEFAINLEKGKLIEGTLIDHKTGQPIPDHKILFFEYFDVTSKRTGQTRTFPINSHGTTDAQGKFRRTVLPGKYGVCIYPAADTLFIPDMIKKATIADVSDWKKNEERSATVFQVSEKDKTINPVLRVVNQE